MKCRRSRIAMTLIELLVCIAIIGVMIGMLLPALQKASQMSKKTKLLASLKDSGTAIHGYHDVHGNLCPFASEWRFEAKPFVEGLEGSDPFASGATSAYLIGTVFTVDGMFGGTDKGWNDTNHPLTLAHVADADGTSSTIMLAYRVIGCLGGDQAARIYPTSKFEFRQSWGACFADGSVRTMSKKLDSATTYSLITWNGGELVDVDEMAD